MASGVRRVHNKARQIEMACLHEITDPDDVCDRVDAIRPSRFVSEQAIAPFCCGRWCACNLRQSGHRVRVAWPASLGLGQGMGQRTSSGQGMRSTSQRSRLHLWDQLTHRGGVDRQDSAGASRARRWTTTRGTCLADKRDSSS